MKALNLSDLGNKRLVRYHCRPGKSHPRGDKRRNDILSHLLEKHPQPVCLRALANAVGLSSINTVWEHVQTLSEAGLVSRGNWGVSLTSLALQAAYENARPELVPPQPMPVIEPELLPLEWIL